MATCASVRVCDVPIDLDGTSTEFTLLDFFEQEQDQKATSTQQKQQVPLPPQRQASTSTSSWSSSSGSFYSDEDDDGEPFSLRLSLSTSSPPTSPLVNSAKCWWTHSPKGCVTPKSSSSEEDLSEWSTSSGTHDSGYFSRPHTMDDQKPCDLQVTKERQSNSQLFFRPVNARDPSCPTKVMVKRIQSSRELNLLQYLNTPGMRYDPWNPSAPLLSILNGEPNENVQNVDESGSESDEEEPWAVLDPLAPYDAQPLATVEEALDFVMQLLQGLVFLHENRIVHGDIRRQVVMMDNGNPSIATGPDASRIQRDVKYFFVEFTHAVVVGDRAEYLFREDLRDLGLLISQALDDNVPELADLIVQMVDTETVRTSRLTTAKQMLDELEHVITDLSADRIKCPL